ncbi:MAG: PIN domain-containing protein [Methanocellales archaeon]|nr:PIN domain-containing protein [Methanocellales archaeon]
MKLVVDTNIIMAAIIRDSATRKLLLNPEFELYLPEYVFSELKRHKDEIINRSALSEDELYILLYTIMDRITIVSKEDFAEYIPKAWKIMAEIDENDTPFLALAMSFENDGIWSEDIHFKEQNEVKVWKTRDLIDVL